MENVLVNSTNTIEKSVDHGAIYKKSCASCNNPAKYCCPKCTVLSCSLKCVNEHKTKQSCDGVRNQAAFVPVEDFREKHLCSDLHFLEEINRKIDNANREKKNYGHLFYKPINLDRLKKVAMSRKTKLEILPISFSKRKASTTFLRYRDNKIFWRIEWSFPLCDITYADERIDEEDLLGKCLDKYLLPGNAEANEKLEYYQSMGHNGVVVLLKDESTTSNELRGRYYILRQYKSLRVNFRGKRIIEFPTLVVVPKIHLSAYDIIE